MALPAVGRRRSICGLIEEVIRQGKEAIVLVPEISLTPQTIHRFRGRCGEVAVLHSHLRDAERGGQWRRVASGQVQVVVGARSAVFAPTRRLGLIVIDEEHEGTFKQESTPRYHARDVAVMRARLENIPILLGSATPSFESWHNAERGQYTLLSLPNRVLERPLPHVGLIDLRHERLSGGRFHALSSSLERAMRDALRAGGQVMLLLNRRGFSTHVHCPACGHVETCRFCDLALTYHRQRAVMLCHYCGYEQQPPELCPSCGQTEIHYQGLGTEKLQTEIEQKFPGLVVRRMDSDSMRQRGSHARVLSAFRKGLIHILLGTQMIAKGLDFPNVTLVGVINADIGLHLPDFRSGGANLSAPVASRRPHRPRGTRRARAHPDLHARSPMHCLGGDARLHRFCQPGAGPPPAAQLPALRAARPPDRAQPRAAGRCRLRRAPGRSVSYGPARLGIVSGTQRQPLRLLGPAEAPVFRLKGYYRFHFQLQSASAAALHQLLRNVLPAVRPPAGVEFTVDVDPFNML